MYDNYMCAPFCVHSNIYKITKIRYKQFRALKSRLPNDIKYLYTVFKIGYLVMSYDQTRVSMYVCGFIKPQECVSIWSQTLSVMLDLCSGRQIRVHTFTVYIFTTVLQSYVRICENCTQDF